MSKIARQITKKAGTVALAASILLQSAPMCAIATEVNAENTVSVVQENEEVKETAEAVTESTEEAAPAVEEETIVEKSEAVEEAVSVDNGIETAGVENEPKAEIKEEVEDEASLIPDAGFREEIKRNLKKPSDYNLTKADLEGIYQLTVWGRSDIESIEGIENLVNLYSITFKMWDYVDLSPLEKVSKLSSVTMEASKSVDLNVFRNVSNLSYLSLNGITNENLDALKNLKDLRTFTSYFSDNLKDVSGISELPNLSRVQIGGAESMDLNDFSNLTNLTLLRVDNITNENLDALKNLKNLRSLEIRGAADLDDINGLAQLTDIHSLLILGSKLSDISILANLKGLEYLGISETNVSDVTVLAQLPNLIMAMLPNNKITDISELYSQIPGYFEGIFFFDGNMISDATPILSNKVLYQVFTNQDAFLKEIVTEGGDVVYKLPYDRDVITSIEIDENIGKYDYETNTITFYNVTSDRTLDYKIRLQNNLNGDDPDGSINENPGYDYSAILHQPIRIGVPVQEEPAAPSGSEGKQESSQVVNTAVKNDSVKTGDGVAAGTLAFAAISLLGAVKTRRRK